MAASTLPDLAVHDGRPVADSRDVARTFGRMHKDVLKAYRNLECSDGFRRRNFAPFETNDLAGLSLSHVLMTKNGFSFLALGFTGAKAAAFKEAYVERFDAMEAELRAPSCGPEVRIADNRMQMVAECRRIFGLEAARGLWKDVGLPDVPAPAIRPVPRRSRPKADLAERAASIIRGAPGQRISRADLYRRMDHSVRFAALNRIVAEMVASGRIVVEGAAPEARIGRPPVFYRWVGDA